MISQSSSQNTQDRKLSGEWTSGSSDSVVLIPRLSHECMEARKSLPDKSLPDMGNSVATVAEV